MADNVLATTSPVSRIAVDKASLPAPVGAERLGAARIPSRDRSKTGPEQFRLPRQEAIAELTKFVDSIKPGEYPPYIGDNKHSGAKLVQALTTVLNELGHYGDYPTGNYHGRSEAIKSAVKASQTEGGLRSDGLAGGMTVKYLLSAYERRGAGAR